MTDSLLGFFFVFPLLTFMMDSIMIMRRMVIIYHAWRVLRITLNDCVHKGSRLSGPTRIQAIHLLKVDKSTSF